MHSMATATPGPRPSRLGQALPAALLAAASLFPVAPAGADVIRLKNGARLEGRVFDQGERIVLETVDGLVVLRRDLVATIDSGPTSQDLYLARRAGLDPGDTRGLFDLGLWCRRSGLYREGAEVFRAILEADPDHAGAREELGYRRAGETWARGAPSRVEGDRVVVQHGLPEAAALAARATLESFHDAFSRAYCPPLRFHRVHKTSVLLFARRAEYLEHVQEAFPGLTGRSVAFDRFPRAFTEVPSGRILGYLEAEEPHRLLQAFLMHEATHAMLAMTRDPKVRAPAWLEEGLADTLACSTIEKGEVKLAQGVADHPFFQGRMAEAKEAVSTGTALPLRALLKLESFDFADPLIGVRYAQSVSLLHVLLRIECARRPAAFRDYLAAAQEGKGGVEDFERIFGAKVEAVEERWRAFVLQYRPEEGK
jgi:hypothetical protein